MANKVNNVPTVEKTALEIMAEKMAQMETMRLEMEKMKASMLTERESVLPGLKAERATLATRLAEIDKAISVFEPVIVVKSAGRPKMTDEQKAAAKLAREAKAKENEKAQVMAVLNAPAPAPSNVVNIPVQPAPVEQLAMAK